MFAINASLVMKNKKSDLVCSVTQVCNVVFSTVLQGKEKCIFFLGT